MDTVSESIRRQLHAAVADDLLGPAEGPHEEIVDSSVRSRYLVGQLAPMNLVLEPDDQDELPKEGTTVNDDGESEEDRLQSESLMPSSIGLTFAVDSSFDRIRVEARWGRYDRTKSELGLLTEGGQSRAVWKRRSEGRTGGHRSPRGDNRRDPRRWLTPGVHPGTVRLTAGGDRLVTLFLANEQTQPEQNRDAAWLFQPELIVTGPDGSAAFRRRPTLDGNTGVFGGPEQRAMRMLHRNRVEFALGHGVSVHANVPNAASPDRADRIETRVIPFYDVAVTEPPTAEDDGFERLADLHLDMQWLAEADRADVVANLQVLTERMPGGSSDRSRGSKPASWPITISPPRRRWKEQPRALERLRAGIKVLADESSPAFKAFQFANRAMWFQRVRSEYVRRRRLGDEVSLEEIDVPGQPVVAAVPAGLRAARRPRPR